MRIALDMSLTGVIARQGAGEASPTQENLVAPRFTGAMTQGKTLTSVAGVWTDSPSVTRQWYANAVAIGGATGSTYALTASEVGDDITLEETADYGDGLVLASLSDARGPVITEATVYSDAVAATAGAGLDTILDGLWVLGGASKADAAINRLNPGTRNLTELGTGPVFTAYQGTRHGTAGNRFEAFDPSSGGVNFAQNSNSFGLWNITNATNTLASMGMVNFLLNPMAAPDIPRYRNASSTTDSYTGVLDARGFLVCTRAASGAFKVFKNKDLIEDQTRTSAALTSGNFRINGWGDGVSQNHNDATRTLALAFMGGALTEAQIEDLTDIWGLCLNRLGVITPEITRLMGAFDGHDLIVTADLQYAYEPGMRTKLVVAEAADTGFAAPIFDGDVQPASWAGIFMPVKHTAPDLPPDTDIIFKIEALRP